MPADGDDDPGADSPVPAEPYEIRVDDLLLRAFAATDVPDLVAVFRDPDVTRWNPNTSGSDDEQAAAAAFADNRADWSGRDHLSWAVADAATGRLLGSVSLHHLDLAQGTGEIGYWTAPWGRGRGVATRAVVVATRVAFDLVGLRRVELYHSTDNEASCTVATRAGYQLEGVLRQSYVYGDGRPHDEHVHGRLRTDPGSPTDG